MGQTHSLINDEQPLYDKNQYVLVMKHGESNVLQNIQTRSCVSEITKIFQEENDLLCNSSKSVSLLYEYQVNSLQQNINLRKKQNLFFEEGELWFLLKECINALSYIQSKGFVHYDIRPSSILLTDSGQIKLLERFSQDSSTHIYNIILQKYKKIGQEGFTKEIFLSPQVLSCLQNKLENPENVDFQKNSIFCLGLSILEAATLQSVQQCYDLDNLEFQPDPFEQLIKIVSDNYSSKFYIFLGFLLSLKEEARQTLEFLSEEIEVIINNWVPKMADKMQIIKDIDIEEYEFQQQIEQDKEIHETRTPISKYTDQNSTQDKTQYKQKYLISLQDGKQAQITPDVRKILFSEQENKKTEINDSKNQSSRQNYQIDESIFDELKNSKIQKDFDEINQKIQSVIEQNRSAMKQNQQSQSMYSSRSLEQSRFQNNQEIISERKFESPQN